MKNISDIIEDYLKNVLEISEKELVEIKRSEIADKFQCVPSQINYVINTRFTLNEAILWKANVAEADIFELCGFSLMTGHILSNRSAI